MDLEKIVTDQHDDIEEWTGFRDGFEVLLQHVDRKTLQDIRQRSTKTAWRNHQPSQEVDEEKFAKALSGYIKDWRGLTGKVLRTMFPLKQGAVRDDEPVPCTTENKLFLLKRAYDFDQFVFSRITEIAALQAERKEAELKNSGPLSPGV